MFVDVHRQYNLWKIKWFIVFFDASLKYYESALYVKGKYLNLFLSYSGDSQISNRFLRVLICDLPFETLKKWLLIWLSSMLRLWEPIPISPRSSFLTIGVFFANKMVKKRGGVGIGIGSHRISRKFMEQEKMHGLPQIPGFFLLILQRNPDIRRRRYPFLFYDSLSIEYIRNVVIKISGRKIQKK